MRLEDMAEMSNKEVHGVERKTTRRARRRKVCSARRRNRQIDAQRNSNSLIRLAKGRRNAARMTLVETSAKLYWALEKATTDFNR